jgi:two-component system KDP operon response regulator KdpE
VVTARDGPEALRAVEESLPDLMVLDISLPGLDGFEVCRRVRDWSQVPIIMLSGWSDPEDRVKLLRLGADDYLLKPFSVEEFIARVEAVLRRNSARETVEGGASYCSGSFEVNFAERRVKVGGREVALTRTEYELLRELVVHRGKVLTHRMLLHAVWGPDYGEKREYVRVFVNRLRQKLGDESKRQQYIETLPGVGYRFVTTA